MVMGFRVWASRFGALFARSRREAELCDEVRAHLDRLAEDHRQRGLSPRAAEAAARRDFGGVDQMKEAYRDQRGLPVVEAAARDVQYALRGFRKNPGFVGAVVLSLALGIGVTSAVFTVVNALMLTLLPVHNPRELFVATPELVGDSADAPALPARFSFPAFESLRRAMPASGSLAAMSRVARMYRRAGGEGGFQQVSVQLVSGEFFSVLGVSAVRGRLLGAADNRTLGGHPVAVMSHALWSGAFGADETVIGRILTVNGQPLTIVGVAPAGFSGVWLESPVDLWIPLMMQDEVHYRQNYSASGASSLKPWVPQESLRWLDLVGRKADAAGTSTAVALTSAFQGLVSRAAEGMPEALRTRFRQQRLALLPFGRGFSNLRTNFAPPLFALFGMAALVLLIACANAANLMLARAAARRREIAIRVSLGASRGRVIQQLLTESVLLSAVACAAGLLTAGWTADLLVRRAAGTGASLAVGVDWRVVAFAVVSAVATVLLAGLAPAFRTTKVETSLALRAASARGARAQPRLQKALVAAQVALSLVLVVAAGLFAQTLRNYARLSLGYTQEHVLSVSINFVSTGYPVERLGGLSEALIERVQAVPGVISASTAMCGLASGCRATSDIVIDSYRPAPGEFVRVQENRVSSSYFATTGMRLLDGRGFDGRDRADTTKVAVVNRSMARRYFPGQSPIGRRFGYDTPDIEIVGVVEDGRVNRVQQAPTPMAFYPMSQGADPEVVDARTSGDPRVLINEIRRAVSDVVPSVPTIVFVLSDQVTNSLNQERLVAGLTTIFGVLALGLASLGLFGVMSYAVTQRTVEFGIRLALGAPRSSVLAGVLRESLAIAGLGLAAGVPAVLALSRATGALLFGISPTDFTTMSSGIALLIVVAAAASIAPAWRASRVDPIVALRQE
jgi:predicted permease